MESAPSSGVSAAKETMPAPDRANTSESAKISIILLFFIFSSE